MKTNLHALLLGSYEFKGVNDVQEVKNALVNFDVGYHVSESKPSTILLHKVLNIRVSVLREFAQFILT